MSTGAGKGSVERDSIWQRLPNEAILHIFSWLNDCDLLACGLTCSRWYGLFLDPLLWKRRLISEYYRQQATDVQLSDTGMFMEMYRRLKDDVPRVCVQEVKDHSDEVLHVCVSHSGHLAATCSKDRTVRIWTISEQFTLQLMKVVKPDSTGSVPVSLVMHSYFSPDDSFLAICGAMEEVGMLGVIRIYDVIADNLTAEYVSLPFDCFTTWISNSDVIVGYGHFDVTALFTLYRGDARANSPLQPVGCISLPSLGLIRQLAAILDEQEGTTRLYYIGDIDGEWNVPYQVSCVELPSSKTSNTNYPDETDHPGTLVPVALADLDAYIIGLKVSSDRMFLLVNCRPSASGSLIEQLKLTDKPPIISDRMKICILKASNLQVVGTVCGHVGFSQGLCYYILLDSSKHFIARQVKNIVT